MRPTKAAGIFGGVVLLAAVGAVLLWAPEWMVNQHLRRAPQIPALEYTRVIDDYRRTLAQALAGMVVLAGLYFTARTVRTAEEGRTTERFTKSIEQLGATDGNGAPILEIRLGGIYGLEALARDSARYHGPAMEVLTAYVRHHSTLGGRKGTETPHPEMETSLVPKIGKDIQAILTVIGRRKIANERNSGLNLDLRLIDISTATLAGANLDGVLFLATRIESADLRDVRLNRAKLFAASLKSSSLKGAALKGAVLSEAHLEDADLTGADLAGADLQGAHLEGSILIDTNVSQDQIQHAFGDEFTRLPKELAQPGHWSGRNEIV